MKMIKCYHFKLSPENSAKLITRLLIKFERIFFPIIYRNSLKLAKQSINLAGCLGGISVKKETKHIF